MTKEELEIIKKKSGESWKIKNATFSSKFLIAEEIESWGFVFLGVRFF